MRLSYRHNICVSDLAIGECTVHRAGNSAGARWWLLWFRVYRDDDGRPDDFAVPINPNGPWLEDGPGGKTWSLAAVAALDGGIWQISPSINVLGSREVHPGEQPSPSIWHQIPEILGVPYEGVAWTKDPP